MGNSEHHHRAHPAAAPPQRPDQPAPRASTDFPAFLPPDHSCIGLPAPLLPATTQLLRTTHLPSSLNPSLLLLPPGPLLPCCTCAPLRPDTCSCRQGQHNQTTHCTAQAGNTLLAKHTWHLQFRGQLAWRPLRRAGMRASAPGYTQAGAQGVRAPLQARTPACRRPIRKGAFPPAPCHSLHPTHQLPQMEPAGTECSSAGCSRHVVPPLCSPPAGRRRRATSLLRPSRLRATPPSHPSLSQPTPLEALQPPWPPGHLPHPSPPSPPRPTHPSRGPPWPRRAPR